MQKQSGIGPITHNHRDSSVIRYKMKPIPIVLVFVCHVVSVSVVDRICFEKKKVFSSCNGPITQVSYWSDQCQTEVNFDKQ